MPIDTKKVFKAIPIILSIVGSVASIICLILDVAGKLTWPKYTTVPIGAVGLYSVLFMIVASLSPNTRLRTKHVISFLIMVAVGMGIMISVVLGKPKFNVQTYATLSSEPTVILNDSTMFVARKQIITPINDITNLCEMGFSADELNNANSSFQIFESDEYGRTIDSKNTLSESLVVFDPVTKEMTTGFNNNLRKNHFYNRVMQWQGPSGFDSSGRGVAIFSVDNPMNFARISIINRSKHTWNRDSFSIRKLKDSGITVGNRFVDNAFWEPKLNNDTIYQCIIKEPKLADCYAIEWKYRSIATK